ncbi:MAG: diguanylate cyclase [Actinomycetota bacterium]|nr:diguanylate cyclase [Actinomycetota bacterium]
MQYEKQDRNIEEKLSDALFSYLRIDPTPLLVTKSNKILWINDALEELLAIGLDDVFQLDISEVVIDELPTIKIRNTQGKGTAFHNTGREIGVHVQATPVGDDTTVIKITPMSFEKSESEITKYRERLWVLANQIKIGVFYSEAGARIQFANDAMAQIYESPIETLLGTGWIDQIPPKQREKVERTILDTLSGQSSSVEIKITTLTNRVKDVLLTLSPIISNDSKFGFAATAEDITERLQKEQEMERAALYDSLTGLKNRISLNHNYHDLIDQLQSGTINSITAIFCDLNNFKTVNDTYGHNAGDRVLISFATALSRTLGSHLVPYRYAGDEFVVIGTDLAEEELRETLSELRRNTSLEISFGNNIIRTNASFGYHTTDSNKHELSELIAEADCAMYKEKQETRATREGK